MWLEIKDTGLPRTLFLKKMLLSTQPSLPKPHFPLSGITMLTSYHRYWQAYANGSTVNTNPFLRPPI